MTNLQKVNRLLVLVVMVMFTTCVWPSLSSMSCPPLCEESAVELNGDALIDGECVIETASYAAANEISDVITKNVECKMSPLTGLQKQQWEASTTRLQQLKRVPSSTLSKSEPIFTVTKEQQDQAIQIFPGLFKTRQEIDRLQRRTKRTPSGIQICQPNQVWNTVTLAVNYLGDIVQVLQPSGNLGQWILEESCQSEISPSTGDACAVTTRTHNILVYDFVIDDWEIEPVEVFCCVAFTTA